MRTAGLVLCCGRWSAGSGAEPILLCPRTRWGVLLSTARRQRVRFDIGGNVGAELRLLSSGAK